MVAVVYIHAYFDDRGLIIDYLYIQPHDLVMELIYFNLSLEGVQTIAGFL
jgi:hypothetical protein